MEETGFNWGEYLEETGASAAPHASFRHVRTDLPLLRAGGSGWVELQQDEARPFGRRTGGGRGERCSQDLLETEDRQMGDVGLLSSDGRGLSRPTPSDAGLCPGWGGSVGERWRHPLLYLERPDLTGVALALGAHGRAQVRWMRRSQSQQSR